ncbi:hypothetical protein Tdes44962_MAKER07101 [Teratosphaeria destructans]|uniref:Uncharacterized protein n=1 Tax=Teratosphaeria destructans TaxID=418781 RepID=A0A9W7T016_9PEZI|nr:hypothetical protein Tdes44962_MAKER07101 [Teratosphaeria destructans]
MADPLLLARQGYPVPSFVRSILASQSAAAESAASAASELDASYASATSADAFDATATGDTGTTWVDLNATTTADVATTPTAATDKATLEGVSPAYAPTSTSTVGQETETGTFLPLTEDVHTGHSGMSHGALAAAIGVPVLVAILALLLAYLFLRRRHNRKLNPHTRMPSASAFLEKGDTRTSLQPLSRIVAHHERNSAYFTGLDTSASADDSRAVSGEYYPAAGDAGAHRRGTSDASTVGSDPPPPYKPMTASGRTSSTTVDPLAVAFDPSRHHRPNYVLPDIPTLTREDNHSPFTDAAAVSFTDAPDLSPLPDSPLGNTLRPTTSRTVSARSFSSTLYSDNASVHSARAQRVSVVPIMMDRMSGEGRSAPVSPALSLGDPFEDVAVFGRRGSGVSTVRSSER